MIFLPLKKKYFEGIKRCTGLLFNGRHAWLKRLLAVLFIFLIWLLLPLPSPLFKNSYSTVILDENDNILKVYLNRDEQWCLPPDARQAVPEKLKTAVLVYEDRYFYHHPGVNPVSLFRAIYQNITSGRVVSGASTITMQVARLRKPKNRNYFNKMKEILMAVKIEVHFNKEEILRLYLDHAPYGGNIIGYKAAVHRFFGKIPGQVTWSEAAMLAVLPNAPGLITPTANRQRLIEKRNNLLKKLNKAGIIDNETLTLSMLEEVPEKVIPFDDLAPHLSRRLKQQYPASEIIKTTLNKEIQEKIARFTTRHLEYLSQFGIRNGCVLVAETETGKVKAYVGSQKFYDEKSLGQVDGITAPRSAGSILKPFLYAMAMDDGIILPQTLIKDVPTSFDAFSPANATETYDGILTAHDALARSLNVPAVRLLNIYGVYPFYIFLKNAGVTTLFRNADDYGLPLILGGAEVTAWDLTRLYRGLARGGVFEPLQVIEDQTHGMKASSAPLISKGACYLTLEILKELKRPGAEYFWRQYSNQYPIAWKTGTSYGHKDSWAVGTTPEWTIAVWIGNFDGEGNKNLSGAGSAGPLLFQVFNSLPHRSELSWFEKPENNLATVELCAETGFLAGENCPNTILAEAPADMKPLRICPYHEAFFLDRESRYAVCSQCWEPGYTKKSYLVFPPDVAQFLYEKGYPVQKVPPHNPRCPANMGNRDLQILYPYENAILWLPRDFNLRYQEVVFRAANRNPSLKVYWYLNEKLLGTTSGNHIITSAVPVGWHEIFVIDDAGNKDRKKFYVDRRQETRE
ncbi:MAG: penicillin-binding protein 1C [Bacteroidales bacterium]|nr:penicillin-binding protein 1C [Bacteroidales bacterium]